MTIASEIQDLATNLASAKLAVTAKGGTVGDTGLAGLATEIASIPAGGGLEPKDINFYDLDANLVEAWTLAELQNKTELPANPTAPTGLTAKGWNWTLQQLKSENKITNVGQVYAPTDGKTHLFVHVDADHLSPNMAFGLDGTAYVDWGDGTTATWTGTNINASPTDSQAGHTYASAGDYEVTIDIAEGSSGKVRANYQYVSFLWKKDWSQSSLTDDNKAYGSQLRKVWIGERMILADACFSWLGIQQVVIPDTFATNILPTRMFFNCYGFKNTAVILPPIFSSTPAQFLNGMWEFNGQVCLPYGITTIDSYFMGNCSSFTGNVTVPTSVTTIRDHFLYNASLYKGPMSIPSSVTTIQHQFMAATENLRYFEVNTSTVPPSADPGLFTTYINSPAKLNGVILAGTEVSAWMTALPNGNYRNFIDGTA